MKKQEGIISYIDYGYIEYDIKKIMNKKNLSKTQITKRTGLHHQVIERYMNNTVTRFDRDVLAKLCFVLECDLNEIIKYIRPKN